MAAARVFIAAALLLATPAIAAALTWPGVPPCNATLQACIDAAASQDIVEIATNGPIDESPRIEMSLTLRAADGFRPVFRALNSVFALADGNGDKTITIEGLTLENGSIHAQQNGTGVFTISILNNVLNISSPTFVDAIRVGLGGSRPAVGNMIFNVSGNSITVDVEPTEQLSAITAVFSRGSTNTGIIARNAIFQRGGNQTAAIAVFNADSSLAVDLIANHVAGTNVDYGIRFAQPAGGNLMARIINNLLTGQADQTGMLLGLSLRVSGGTGHFEVINNTIADNERGLAVSARVDLGAVLTGFAANNIIAFNREYGVLIEEDTFENRSNLVFGNGFDSFIPGPGTLVSDPEFVAPADYHLRPSSPAFDSGNSADVPAEVTIDLDGNPRIVRRAVDRGAFERALGCAGDCDGDGAVSINELILGVSIALGQAALHDCPVFDSDGSDSISIGELIAAVNAALAGCPRSPTPTATRVAIPTRTATATHTRTPASTRTRTAGMSCGASAPECLGTCPVRRICEPDGTGGCHCVDIDAP